MPVHYTLFDRRQRRDHDLRLQVTGPGWSYLAPIRAESQRIYWEYARV